MYSGDEYAEVAAAESRMLDELTSEVTPDGQQWRSWEKTFGDATRLEVGFWDMGLE